MWTGPYTPDAQDPPVVPSLLRARNIERDGQALAFAKWPCAVPHVGGEQHQPPGPRLDLAERREVDVEAGCPRLPQSQITGLILAEVRRQRDV